MSYRQHRRGHRMSVLPLLLGKRYVTCSAPGCRRVRRSPYLPALIHKGKKP